MQHIGKDFSPQANATRKLNDKVILVVEDDDSIGALLVEVLAQETPYRAMWVTDGLQALNAVDAIRPALVITDYRLPNMDGIELYDQLLAFHGLANTPTILMSAYLPPTEEISKRHLVSLNKPFELDELLSTINTLLPD